MEKRRGATCAAFLCGVRRPASPTPAQALLFCALVLLVQVILATGTINDLDLFLAAGADLLNGGRVYRDLYNEAYSYFYGPVFALLLRPLAWLPDWWGELMWGLSGVAFLARSLVLLGRWNQAAQLARSQLAVSIIAVVVFAFQPIRDNLNAGQTSFLLLWTMLEAIALAERGKWFGAALLLAFGTDIKLLPLAVWAYLLYRGHWRTAALAPVLLVVLSWGLPALIFGPERSTELLNDRVALIDPGDPRHVLDEEEPDFLSIGAVLSAYLSAEGGNRFTLDLPRQVMDLPLSTMLILIPVARLVLASSLLFVLGWPPFRARSTERLAGRELAWLFALIPLVFPHQQTYSLLYALPAVVHLAVRWWAPDGILRNGWAQALLLLAYACLNAHLWLGHFGPVYDHYKLPVLGLLALGVLVAVDKPGTRMAGPTGERPSASGA